MITPRFLMFVLTLTLLPVVATAATQKFDFGVSLNANKGNAFGKDKEPGGVGNPFAPGGKFADVGFEPGTPGGPFGEGGPFAGGATEPGGDVILPSGIPVPAGLPLVLSGIGALMLTRRRKRPVL